MSTASVSGAFAPGFPTIDLAAQSAASQTNNSSLRQLSGSLQNTVLGFQEMIQKIQAVVQMIFAEILGRIGSILTCFSSFNTCIEKLEQAFCPTLVSAPDLNMSIKQALASIVFTGMPPIKPSDVKA